MSEALRTPLSRVRGLGSAKEGSSHFIQQRVSAVALALLGPWFLISAALWLRQGYETAYDFFAAPVNAVLGVLLLGAGFYHMRLGMQVIIEDYIHKAGMKALLSILNTFVAYGLAAAGVFAILKISLGV